MSNRRYDTIYIMNGQNVPSRNYPRYKIRNGKRYILKRGEHISFPEQYTYHQYLVLVLLPIVLGIEILTTDTDSRYHKMIKNHVLKFANDPVGKPVLASNADALVLQTASDLETLFLNEILPTELLKRLKSGNDDEMRGALYEVSLAAAHYRCGYEIKWLKGHSLPEFKATRQEQFYVEAKRRNRTKSTGFNIKTELRAYRQRVKEAMGKANDLPMMIFLDTDLPPRNSKTNEELYKSCNETFGGKPLGRNVLIITNSGYEYDAESTSEGFNSVMIIRGNEAPHSTIINEIVTQLSATLPDYDGSDWTHK
jgi:hypothetical protein